VLAEAYRDLVRVAAAVSHRGGEAGDLLQSVLLEAIERGVADLGAAERRAWLRGAIRRRASFEARTAVRARRRETSWAHLVAATPDGDEPVTQPWRFSSEMLDTLAPSLRTLAALASAELEGEEIRSVLRLTDTAFRKRLSMLRRALHQAPIPAERVVARPRQAFALGTRRAELISSLRRQPAWAIASHDPDGHALIFSIAGAHKRPPDGNSG
jgi:DNA-directed RNA polymerase specialized sigma24 family protein